MATTAPLPPAPIPPNRLPRSRPPRRRWWQTRNDRHTHPLIYVALIGAVAVSLFPFYWLFVVASNDTAAMSQLPPKVTPGGNFLTHAREVLDTIPFVEALVNSFIVSACITVSVVFFATLAGFAFAKLQFRGRGALFIIVIATMMVPVQLGIIPQYMIMSELGWINSLRAVIVPYMVTAFGVFWMRQFISGAVPNELLDAARVDGCSTFRLFRHVVVPAVRPAAAVLGLLTFMQAWNEFIWPLVVLHDPESFTVQIALRQLNDAYYQNYALVMAGTVMATLPLVIIFVLLGKQIVGGLMEGALKG